GFSWLLILRSWALFGFLAGFLKGLRLANNRVGVERIECFRSALASEILDLFDPDGKLERRGPAHCRQSWAIAAQCKLESLVHIARLIAIALLGGKECQEVLNYCLICSDLGRC